MCERPLAEESLLFLSFSLAAWNREGEALRSFGCDIACPCLRVLLRLVCVPAHKRLGGMGFIIYPVLKPDYLSGFDGDGVAG